MPEYRFTGGRDYYDASGDKLSEGDVIELSEYAYGLHEELFERAFESKDESADAGESEGVAIPDDYDVLRKAAASADLPNATGRSGKDEIVSDLQAMDDDELSDLIASAREEQED